MKPSRVMVVVAVVIALTAGYGLGPWAASHAAEQAPGRTMAQQATKDAELWITTDHSKHEILQQTFTSGPQVTKACVSCHSEAETQFHKTIHWTWKAGENEKGVQMGKAAYSLNNFCISANKDQDKGCYSCHPGWGSQTEATNCLVCHGKIELKWEESFDDYNAFMEESEEDPDLKELADEIQVGESTDLALHPDPCVGIVAIKGEDSTDELLLETTNARDRE